MSEEKEKPAETMFRCFRLTVDELRINATSMEEMENRRDDAKSWEQGSSDKPNTDRDQYIFCWSEGGIMNSTEERNAALAGFLELLTKVIPLTPYSPPLIIIPGGRPLPPTKFLKEG